jgi:hypothetical protein
VVYCGLLELLLGVLELASLLLPLLKLELFCNVPLLLRLTLLVS